MLLLLISLVTFRTYELWQEGPWELPAFGKERPAPAIGSDEAAPQRSLLASTKNIVDRNLFDPERGQGRTKEGEALSSASQRIRSMVLLGTAILGSSRYAILQEPSDARPLPGKSQPAQSSQIRLKVGDTVEGFRVAEIYDQKVVFSRGPTQVEVSLDFMRKFDEAKEKVKTPVPAVGPRVPSTIPRRNLGEAPARPVE